MSLFKRFTATFTGTLAQAAAQIENHDAVVEAALRDTRRAAAKAKVRLARVKRDGAQLRKSLTELEASAVTWAERAKSIAGTDEDKALICLQRHNDCREQAAVTATALSEHKTREAELSNAVQRIEERIREIESTRNLLRSRQSTAEANRQVTRLATTGCYELDDVLERWEMRVLETEYLNPASAPDDALNDEFTTLEEQDALRAQLNLLLRNEADAS
jgi:phage shock protein A